MTAIKGTLGSFSTVGSYGTGTFDPGGTQQMASGGNSTALNVTAAQVIKATPGRVARIAIISAGTSSSLVLNDCTTVAASTTSNEVAKIAFNATGALAGQIVAVDFPFTKGIVVSAVPGAGSPQYAISYY